MPKPWDISEFNYDPRFKDIDNSPQNSAPTPTPKDSTSFNRGVQNYKRDFKDVNTSILADTFQRVTESDPATLAAFVEDFSNSGSRAYNLAKRNEFNLTPGTPWADYLEQDIDGSNYEDARNTKENIPRSLPSFALKNATTLTKETTKKFLDKFKYPDFIAEPLKLRNPVVSAKSGIPSGTNLNAEAVQFLKDFKPEFTGSEQFGYSVYTSPFGSEVYVANAAPTSQRPGVSDIAFKGPTGYYKEKGVNDPTHPLLSPALHYSLGQALKDVPVGYEVTANPIEGPKGARARAYRMLTKGALTADQLGILSQRTGPTTWNSSVAGEREFDPATLKDSMIRSVYDMPKTQDVSDLRNNPLGLLERTNRVDFTKPVITTNDPVYRARLGIKGAFIPSAVDLIPSPEAIDSFYAKKPAEGLQRMAGDFAKGIPVAALTGTAVALGGAALAPLAAGVGGGMGAIRGAQALNRVVEHQTGEGLQSKWEQTLGVRRRTGVANPDYQRSTQPNYTPQTITSMTPAQRTEHLRQQGLNPWQKARQEAERVYNPKALEFGASETLKGAGQFLQQLPGQIPGMLSTFFQRR